MIEVELPNGDIVEFPDSMSKEDIQAVLYRHFSSAESQAPSSDGQKLSRRQKREVPTERELAQQRLEQENPYLAQMIADMNPFEKALVGAGGGFNQLLAGMGLTEIGEDERKTFSALTDTSGAALAGQITSQAAPFAGAGLLAGSALKTAPLVARGAAQGAIGAAEGNIIARGTGGDTGDVVAGTVIGGALGPIAEVAGPAINRAARSLVQKIKGGPPSGVLIDDAGRPTRELQSALDQSGKTFDELVSEATQGGSIESVVSAGRSGRKGAEIRAVEDVAGTVNPETMAASERLGLGDAPLAVVTDDAATQELGGIMAAIPASESSIKLNAYVEEFGRRADSLVEELGGSLDRGFVDQDLLTKMQSDIGRIKAVENVLYDRIRSEIGGDTIVNAKPLKNLLSARARTLGGRKNLSKVEKDVLDRVEDGRITYASLDDIISNVGAAIGKDTDEYSTVQSAKLADMYSNLSKMREGVAETFGQKNNLQRAKKIGAARFGLQEASTSLFGKNLNKSVFPMIDRSVKGLERGNVREFRATMELIPEKFRKPVAATMLNTALSGGQGQKAGINSGQFSAWYSGLSKNETAMNELTKYVGSDAMKRLEDVAKVAKGVAGVTSSRVKTGVASESLKRLNDIDGLVGKIYGAARKAQYVPFAGSAAAAIGNTARLLSFEKTPAIDAAQSIMGSDKFGAAVREAAKNGVQSRRFKRLDSQLKRTPEYKNYIRLVNDDSKSRIAAMGLIPWIASQEDEE